MTRRTAARCALATIAALFLLAAAPMLALAADLPVNPDVTQDNLATTVCVPNWDKPVRPSTAFTNRIKAQKMAALGLPAADALKYELDHVISIVLGGAPRDPANLRVQAWYGDPVETPADADGLDTQAHLKDVLEVRLHKLVCAGQLPLREAQECIYTNWRACAATHPGKE